MVAPIGPGDWVECVKGDYADDGCEVVAGQLYQVLDMSPAERGGCRFECSLDDQIIDVVGQPVCPDSGWCPCQFRPIYRPKSSIIEALKQPAPSELEPA